MPKVPALEGQQVQTQAMPNARLNIDAPLEAFGGGRSIAQVGDATRGLANTAFKIAEEEKKKADDVASMDAYNKLLKKKQELLWDEKSGALARKGQNAFGIGKEYGESFSTFANEIEEGLANDDQKMVFKKMRDKESLDLDGHLQKHVFSQAQDYAQATFKATNETLRNEISLKYHDEKGRGEAMRLQEAALYKQVMDMGMQGQAGEAYVKAELSKSHATIIDRMLNNGMEMRAQDYFSKNKDAFGELTSKVEDALKVGVLRRQSMDESDKIFSQFKNDPVSAYEQVKKIEDPQLRDEVNKRTRDLFSQKKESESLRREELYNQATDIVEKYKSFDKIPPGVVSELSLSERSSLRSYAEKLAKGEDVVTDLQSYYDLKTLAAYDKQAFLKTNLLRYAPKMERGDLKQLIDLQTSMRKGDDKSETELDGYRTNKEIVDDALRGAKISNEEDANKFRKSVETQQMILQKQKGKPLSNDEMQMVVDKLLEKKITHHGWFWHTRVRNFQLDEEVPEKDRAVIEQKLRERGLKPTPALIFDTYKRAKGN